MPTYIAMLRGINVSGQKMIKMETLRSSFGALKLSNIQTYVQSGNVIFGCGNGSDAGLCEKIERRILRDFGFTAPVFLRTALELEQIIGDNPFLKQSAVDPSKLHVTFLSDAAPKMAFEALQPLAMGPEQFH